MVYTQLKDLVPVLQVAIGPVILISGVGLLLLTLTNRFGRAVDRSRTLAREMRELAGGERQRLEAQVQILFKRAGVIRFAITMGAASVLLTGLMIIVLFLTALLQWEASVLIIALFVCCLGSLILSLIAFIREIHLSLVALKLELGVPAANQ
jgi:hypothetical protein